MQLCVTSRCPLNSMFRFNRNGHRLPIVSECSVRDPNTLTAKIGKARKVWITDETSQKGDINLELETFNMFDCDLLYELYD